MIDVFDQFYTDYPGSQVIFEQLLNTITWPKIEKIDGFEYQVIDELALSLCAQAQFVDD